MRSSSADQSNKTIVHRLKRQNNDGGEIPQKVLATLFYKFNSLKVISKAASNCFFPLLYLLE
jgi:hypothetical protein